MRHVITPLNISLIELNKDHILIFLHRTEPVRTQADMTDTLLIWFNPDDQKYEIGIHRDYLIISSSSENQDRFEIIHEFSNETAYVAKKILSALNIVHSSSILNQ